MNAAEDDVFNLKMTAKSRSTGISKISKKRAKISNRYNQAPHLTQDTNGKVTISYLDITNEI